MINFPQDEYIQAFETLQQKIINLIHVQEKNAVLNIFFIFDKNAILR